MLRRTKDQVASELPPKTEIVERIEMEREQRDIYESIRLAMHTKVRAAIAAKGLNRSRIIVLDALLKMRQACCDPRLLKLPAKRVAQAKSAKLERLEELLAELMEEDRRVLIFSQFTSMLNLIRPRLDAMKSGYSLLTGDTRDRPKEIQAFQSAKAVATSIRGFFAIIRASQDPAGAPRRAAHRTTDMAPIINRRRRSR
jgi:SNF2 family DNA or RNA helicase